MAGEGDVKPRGLRHRGCVATKVSRSTKSHEPFRVNWFSCLFGRVLTANSRKLSGILTNPFLIMGNFWICELEIQRHAVNDEGSTLSLRAFYPNGAV